MGPVFRRIFLSPKGKNKLFALRARDRDQEAMGTGQGLVLVFGVAAVVGLVWILVYYAWYLPMQKAVQ